MHLPPARGTGCSQFWLGKPRTTRSTTQWSVHLGTVVVAAAMLLAPLLVLDAQAEVLPCRLIDEVEDVLLHFGIPLPQAGFVQLQQAVANAVSLPAVAANLTSVPKLHHQTLHFSSPKGLFGLGLRWP